MKGFLSKLLKVFLVAALVILIVLFVFGIVLILDWPWWVGFFILLALVGLGIGGLFLRKLLLRRREQHFVQQVIEQDESHLKSLKGKERDNLKGLQDRWKEAIEVLRHSHLRKYGNPLYVLPWYLVFGESGSGKTTAINSARLSSPFAEVSRTTGISGTRNCDWWFFEQAIILDTAGRYAIPVDEGRDKEEWQKFLNLLVKYRRREPLNGLIVTISADKLLEALPEVLEKDGRNIRRRIDELMRVLGVKFPIYVLVTKCDLVHGMTQFCDRLPEKSLDQPMGVINQDLSTDVSAFQDRTINTIGERLRNLRVLLVHQSQSKLVDPGLLLFPEEFENLKRGLESFMKGAFWENPYQETPILRGLFFSSGRQEGSPYSHFLSALGLIGEKEVLPGTSKGLFLHDFFAKILPKDRGLFAPTRRAIEWRALTRNLGLTSWVVFVVAICGLLSFSFVKNLKTLREVSHEFAKPPVLRGEFLVDLITMDRFTKAILRVENQNRNWWIPRFGLNESINVENWLKEKYYNQFQHGFLTPFDKQMEGIITNLTDTTADEIIGQYIAHVVRRINLIKAHLKGEDLDALKEKTQPSYVSLLSAAEQGIGPEVRQTFGFLYLYYLVWRPDSSEINKEIETLQLWLRYLLSLKEKNLQWLVAWVNQEGAIPAVTLREFWKGSLTAPGEKSIVPAFTREGKKMIDSFVKEIEVALPDPLILAKSKRVFEDWYRTASLEKWENFGADFLKGIEKLKGLKEWQQIAEKMATDQGPYFSFLNKISQDLKPLSEGESVPPWLQQVYQFQMLKHLGVAGKGKLAKVAEGGKKVIKKAFGKETEEMSESQILAAQAYHEYQKALTAITPISTSRKQAYQQVLQVYTEDAAASESVFFTAHETATKLKTTMMSGRPGEEVFWELLMGPLDYLWIYARMETACHLQNEWEEKVLSETLGVAGQQKMQILFGQDGSVWKFVKGPIKPFIGWSIKKGYYSKEAESLGGAMPFKNAFFSFLNKGASAPKTPKQNYNVTIKGLPTDVNPEARLNPHETRLELSCAGTSHVLSNKNYPVSKIFSWSHESCSDVLFQIKVGNITLTKKYSGTEAFLYFLQDFQDGQHTFSPREFPAERDSLQRLWIKYIRVNYEFSGMQEILRLFRSLPERIPGSIAWCWDQ